VPQRSQKPRVTPGEEAKRPGSPSVKRKPATSAPISKRTAPQQHPPAQILVSSLIFVLPFAP
jgi:hypothetical protein